MGILLPFKKRFWLDSPSPCLELTRFISVPRVSLTELLLRTGILALKVLIPMLWLQSKLSPVQLFIAGTALIFAAFLFDFLPAQDAGRPPSMQSDNLGDLRHVERPSPGKPD